MVKFARRTLIVQGFQLQFVLTLMIWLGFWLLVFWVLLDGPLIWQLVMGTPDAAASETASIFLLLHRRLWFPLLVLFLGLLFIFLRTTHRVAGPLYRFRRIFEAVGAGDLSVRVRIRRSDYLVEESEALDMMLANLRAPIRLAQERVATIHRELTWLSSKPAITQLDLSRLQELLVDARGALGRLKTTEDHASK